MKTGSRLYVMVADNARARIYSAHSPVQELEVVYSQENFRGRKPVSVADSGEDTQYPWPRTGANTGTDPFSEGDDRFIRDISRVLQQGFRRQDYEGLVLIAPDALLDRLCGQLDRHCLATLIQKVAISPDSLAEQDVIARLGNL